MWHVLWSVVMITATEAAPTSLCCSWCIKTNQQRKVVYILNVMLSYTKNCSMCCLGLSFCYDLLLAACRTKCWTFLLYGFTDHIWVPHTGLPIFHLHFGLTKVNVLKLHYSWKFSGILSNELLFLMALHSLSRDANARIFQAIRCCCYLGNEGRLEDGARADSHLGAIRTSQKTHKWEQASGFHFNQAHLTA